MTFKFAVEAIKYEPNESQAEEMVVTGRLVEGFLTGRESVLVPTISGATHCFTIASLEAPGNLPGLPHWPFLPGGGRMVLWLGGHLPLHDVPVPCTLMGEDTGEESD